MMRDARRWLAPLGIAATGAFWLACSSHTPPPAASVPPIDADTASVRPEAPPPPPRDTVPARTPTPWTDSVLPTMSLHAKAAQLIVRWVPGNAASDAKGAAAAREWVATDSIGGVIVGPGTAMQLAQTTNALQGAAALPLFVAADLEFGAGQRIIPEGTSFPYPMGIAATRDTSFACAAGRITAREARAVGINWTLTPDADLNTRPDNPSIGVRAFGSDAGTVERFVLPYIRCAQGAGVIATVKHFAGLGAVAVDTHIAAAILDSSRARLDTAELRPFRSAAAIGVGAIMSAHVALPALSGDSVPASLNPKLLQGIVRNEWKYDGLLVTDALWMKGAGSDTPGAAAVRALLAGNDVLLDPADHRAAIDAIVAAVGNGTLTAARLDSSVRRVLRAKERLGLAAKRLVDTTAVAAAFGQRDADSVATLAARQSMTLERDRGNAIWRLARASRVLAVLYLDEGKEPYPGAHPGDALVSELRSLLDARGQKLDVVTLTQKSSSAAIAAATERAGEASTVVVALYARPVPARGYAGVPPRIATMTKRIIDVRPNVIVLSLGDPYMVRQFPAVNTYLVGWNPLSPWSERAAAQAIAGRPERDAALAARVADTVRAVMTAFQLDSAFPGAYAVVGTHDTILASIGVGHVDWRPSAEPTDSTLWDLASLTKVVGMTSAMNQLVAEGKVKLDAPAQRYLPRFKDPKHKGKKRWRGPTKATVTVRDLLTHRSGLPAWRPLYKEGVNPDSAISIVYATPLDTFPRIRMVYSDLGAMLLGRIVERVSHEKLDVYLQRHVWKPLGMTDTRFNPDSSLKWRIAPTEYDPYRQRLIWGTVHDENAAALGGVSGHAGLFSSARDLSRFAQMYLNFGAYNGKQVLDRATILDFQRIQDSSFSNRAIGWEKPTGGNSAGRRMSPAAFGHTGFTGTSIWMDPANDVFVVILTNRVNPTRQNPRFAEVRTAVTDAAMSVLETVRQGSTPLLPRK
jgi:beta-glucosidase-like glycosyl hydrolase/CubicO group peptidase (beta-lactamase class C family)